MGKRSLWCRDTTFAPAMEEKRRADLLDGWHKAVERSRGWAR